MVQLTRALSFGALLVLGCLCPGAWASAQAPVFAVGSEYRGFADDRAAWRSVSAAVGVDGDAYDAILTATLAERYNTAEYRFALDTYAVISPLSYFNVRIGFTPDAQVHPEWDTLGELYFTPSSGWEPAIQYRRMAFRSSACTLCDHTVAHIVAPAIARYQGDLYLRLQGIVGSVEDESTSVALAVSIRQYTSDRDFRQVKVVMGREIIELHDEFRSSRSGSISIGGSWPLGARLRLDPNLTFGQSRQLGAQLVAALQIRFGG